MNPYAVLGLVLAWVASAGGAFFYGTHVGANGEIATQARTDQAIQQTREAAQQGAAAAIAANKPTNRTIVQKAEREIQTNTVYRDCRVTPDGLQLANQAITGRPADPAGGVGWPEIAPLVDDSMGALLGKVIELGTTYRECRAAALAGAK